MTSIPRLLTDRLELRALKPRDFDAYAMMMADPEVTRYLGAGQPLDRTDAWRQFAMLVGHWELLGFGTWAVEDRATRVFMGRIGCFQPEGWPGFEIGYTLARPFWGRGYAREGTRAALTWAHETLGRTDVISVIRPENAGSIRVAESLGARLDGDVEFYSGRALIYRYPPRSSGRSISAG